MLSTKEMVYPEGISNEDVERLSQEGINPWVAHALALRGVKEPKIATGKYPLQPYTKLKNINVIAEKLADIILSQEKIVIVADYDCDGATACAVGLLGLKRLGANIDFIVPNRFKNGYGLTPGVVDEVIERFAPQFILTVDNGIASHEGVEYANSKGLKVLVTDHHLPASNKPLPSAEVLVNPNQPEDTSGLGNMAGCGVIYYVVAATRDALKRRNYFTENNPSPNMAEWLDIVAIGTVADVVKLDENNRWLVRHGLMRIKNNLTRPGIRALFSVANKRIENATSQDFGFAVGPRINAAGRLKDMTIGIRCLIAENDEEALQYAKMLDDLNKERKDIGKDMESFAWDVIEMEGQDDKMTRVVHGEDFHEGVIGIVAGKIKENTNRPTIVFANADHPGYIKGSGRSVPGLHLRDALDLVYKEHPEIFAGFGGHAMAAGLTIDASRLDDFKSGFEKAVDFLMDSTPFEKTLEIDAHLPTSYINVETTLAIQNEVWGQGFQDPRWIGTFKVLETRLLGKDQNHVKMLLEKDGQQFDAIQFFNEKEPQVNDVIDIAYKLGINDFRGINVQLMVEEKEER